MAQRMLSILKDPRLYIPKWYQDILDNGEEDLGAEVPDAELLTITAFDR